MDSAAPVCSSIKGSQTSAGLRHQEGACKILLLTGSFGASCLSAKGHGESGLEGACWLVGRM
jgi:hypothetical protein